MSGQPRDAEDSVRANVYPGWVFYVSFGLILVEGLALVTSTVWHPHAPSWANEIVEKKGELLAVAAAITTLMVLILTFRPTGLARYAAIGSGLLSFAAATNSFEIANVETALALFAVILPIYIVSFPSASWPHGWFEWLRYLSVMYLFSLLTLIILISIQPIRDRIIDAGARDVSDFIAFSVVAGILVTMLILGANGTVSLVVHGYNVHLSQRVLAVAGTFRRSIQRISPRRGRNRAARRRERRRRRSADNR